jgi:hypothetical protein
MELAQRIARLERRNRQLVLAMGVMIMVSAFVVWSQKAGAQAGGEDSKTGVSDRLILKGKNGRVAATLWATETGSSLTLNDSFGKPRLVLSVGDEGPLLMMLDQNQTGQNRGIRLAMGSNPKSGPSLSLFGDDPKVPLAAVRTKPSSGEKSASGMLVVTNESDTQVTFPRPMTANKETPPNTTAPANPDQPQVGGAERGG